MSFLDHNLADDSFPDLNLDALPQDIMDLDPTDEDSYQFPSGINYNLEQLLPVVAAEDNAELDRNRVEQETREPIETSVVAPRSPNQPLADGIDDSVGLGQTEGQANTSGHVQSVEGKDVNVGISNVTTDTISPARGDVNAQMAEQMDLDGQPEVTEDIRGEYLLPDGSILVLDKKIPTSNIEIVLSNPTINTKEYEEIMPDTAIAILGTAQDETSKEYFEIEYTDGHKNMVLYHEIFDIENGPEALELYDQAHGNPSRSSKRSRDDDSSSACDHKRRDYESPDELEDSTSIIGNFRQSSIRRSTQPIPHGVRQTSESSHSSDVKTTRDRQHNEKTLTSISFDDDDDSINYEDDFGRLIGSSTRTPARQVAMHASKAASHVASFMSSGDEEDGDFFIVRSDIAPVTSNNTRSRTRRNLRRAATLAQTLQPRRSGSRSSIEFEEDPNKRKSRRAAGVKSYREIDAMDPDSFYVVDDRPIQPPKAVSVKELFREMPADNPFAQVHMQVCDSCNMTSGNGRGILVYCQGCSLSFHRVCIGPRYARDHIATKVGEGNFILQCRFCIAKHAQKDPYAPRYDKCQKCRVPGKSCASFSQKQTPKQEEKLREDNGGIDPITLVNKELVNNYSNVLFRCCRCRRGWHIEHLPPLPDSSSDIPSRLFEEYSKNWKCTDCSVKRTKLDTIVAWRLESDAVDVEESPMQKRARATAADDVVFMDFSEYTDDEKQYLIKWEQRSYHHVTWMPGAWVYSVAVGSSRKSFIKKAMARDLYKKTTKQAVPEEYLMVDVIFNLKYLPDAPVAKTYDKDMDRIGYVSKIYFKPMGLTHADSIWDIPPDDTKPDIYHSFALAYEQYVSGKYFTHEPAVRMRERVAAFKKTSFDEVVLSAQPPELKGKLMDYQLNGVNWMLRRYHSGSNAILADEMGLGKTIQVVTLLTTLILSGPRVWPFLAVVPNSTCPNWRREIKQWSPKLRVVTYYGGKEAQNMAYEHELFPIGSSSEIKAHVVVMSYDSAQDEETRRKFRSVHWAGLVVDEGQRLKNDKNLLYTALCSMKFPFRLLLTGTPLQNNKRELFNLLQFVDTKYDAEALDEQFKDLTSEKIHELHQLINPYFYRRTKAGVLKFLPPMQQIIVPVSMTVVQEKLCKSIMAKNPQLIQAIFRNTKMRTKERGSLNNILMQLRKCLCHPFLYSDAIEERNDDPVISHRNLVEASGKLILLEVLLTRLKEQGHRVLIFSQFLGQLDILEDFLNDMGLESARLDGSVSSIERQKRIDRYNEPGSSLFAFLLTTRAGGVGINLATADTVIILDPDFNPHQDLQALSRAHRIGQRNKVLCLQLMTKDSVEEKMMQMGKKKMALDHALIECMGAGADAGDGLESILKHGAEALFQDNDREVIRYDAAAIEKLLDRSFTKADQESSPEAEFTYGKVWSNEDGGTVKDSLGAAEETEAATSSVWDSILAQREKEAEEELQAKKGILGRGGRARRTINYRTRNMDFLRDSDQSDKDEPDTDFKVLKSSGDEKDDDVEEDPAAMDLDFISPSKKEKKRKGCGLADASQNGQDKMTAPPKTMTLVPPPNIPEPAKAPRGKKYKAKAQNFGEQHIASAGMQQLPPIPRSNPGQMSSPAQIPTQTPAPESTLITAPQSSPAPVPQSVPTPPPTSASTEQLMSMFASPSIPGFGPPSVSVSMPIQNPQQTDMVSPVHFQNPEFVQAIPNQARVPPPQPGPMYRMQAPMKQFQQPSPISIPSVHNFILQRHDNPSIIMQPKQTWNTFYSHNIPQSSDLTFNSQEEEREKQEAQQLQRQQLQQQRRSDVQIKVQYQQQRQLIQNMQEQERIRKAQKAAEGNKRCLQVMLQTAAQQPQGPMDTAFAAQAQHQQAQAATARQQKSYQQQQHQQQQQQQQQQQFNQSTNTPNLPTSHAFAGPSTTPSSSASHNQMKELRMLLPGIFKIKGLKIQMPPPESNELQKAVVPTVAMIRVAIDSLNRLGLPEKIHRKGVAFLENLLQQAKDAQKQGKTITVYPRAT